MSPQAWMASRPSVRPAARARRACSGRGPCSRTARPREGPGMNALAIQGDSASGSASTTGAVWNPPTRRAASTSRANRARKSGSSAYSVRTTLTTIRLLAGVRARYTRPIPPAPRRCVSR
ncbi:hypothetical protein HFP72_00675 [Nocardiopsis sp. ARC36]